MIGLLLHSFKPFPQTNACCERHFLLALDEQSFFLACFGNRVVVNPSKQLQHLKDDECIVGV